MKIKYFEFIIEKNEIFFVVVNVVEKYKNLSIFLILFVLKNILLCWEKDLKVLEDVIVIVWKL